MEQNARLNAAGSRGHYRVVIIEDQVSVRQMLAAVLGSLPEFVVMGGAGDIDEGIRLVRRVNPDVILLDWFFPGGGGAGFLRAMQAERIRSSVLVMSAGTGEAEIREALTSGAKGYIEKVARLDEFMNALRTVAAGGAYFGPMVAEIVERMVEKPERAKSGVAEHALAS